MTIATLDQGIESTFTPNDGIRVGISTGNVAVTVDDHQGRESGVFQLVYPVVTESQKDGFFTEYNSQNRDEFTFTWQLDNTTHTVVYLGQPKAAHLENKNAWAVVVMLAKIPEFGELLDESRNIITDETGDPITGEAA